MFFSPLYKTLLLTTLLFALGLCGAWYFQYILGYIPCDLCYLQRWPYYSIVLLGAGLLFIENKQGLLAKYPKLIILIFMLILMISSAFGIYHAGVEWGFFPAPSSCGGGESLSGELDLSSLAQSLDESRVVPCDKANFRVLGLSFAGLNALLSLTILGFWSKIFCIYNRKQPENS